MEICAVEGCEKPVAVREWCRTHYMRWYRHGDPGFKTHRWTAHPPVALQQRIETKRSVTESGCWEYTGSLHKGYGRIWVGSKGQPGYKGLLVHRAYWEAVVGSLPQGHDLHHLCHNRACFRPEHLDEYDSRSSHLKEEWRLRERPPPKTHCPQGHPYVEWNTYHYRGSRMCRMCRILNDQKRRSR